MLVFSLSMTEEKEKSYTSVTGVQNIVKPDMLAKCIIDFDNDDYKSCQHILKGGSNPPEGETEYI